MLTDHPTIKLLFIAGIIALMTVVPACKKAPEPEPVAPVEPLPEAATETLVSLPLPQSNPEIGIQLSSVPPGLAVTLNTSLWIELTDTRDPSIQYSFVGNPPDSGGPAPSDLPEFRKRVLESPKGKVLKSGTIDTAFGPAQWASGSYVDDDGPVEDINVFVPHPSGNGKIVLRSVCPLGTSTTEDRLTVIQTILMHVS